VDDRVYELLKHALIHEAGIICRLKGIQGIVLINYHF
jgi:hypothetical protein